MLRRGQALLWYCGVPHGNTAVPRGAPARAVAYVNGLPASADEEMAAPVILGRAS